MLLDDSMLEADAGSTRVSRGAFLAGATAVSTTFLLGVDLVQAATLGARVTVYIRINADNSVSIVCPNAEMGQGTSTALPQIVAEELMVDWAQVRIALGGANPKLVNPLFNLQLTAGSTAVRGYHDALRVAGASAREMLLTAGARRLKVARSRVYAKSGVVHVTGSTKTATYAQLAAAAAKIAPPTNPPLTAPGKLRLIGKGVRRLDIPSKVDGKARFGIDVRLPGMIYASVKQAPKMGQTVGTITSRGANVVPVPGGVAATSPISTWHAIRAARGINVTWVDGPHTAATDSATIRAASEALLASGAGARSAKATGDAEAAIAAAAHTVDATYDVPYLAHATLEPLNCTCLVTADRCEIWAPTQAQTFTVGTAAQITGLPAEKIVVHTTFLGGGMGRKFEQDYIAQAVTVAKAHLGTPVKLVWSREEDFTHDQYRPAGLCRITGGVTAAGAPSGVHVRLVCQSILGQRDPTLLPDPARIDSQSIEGLTDMAYAFDDLAVDWTPDGAQVPVGFWRSVGNSHNAFFFESFVDELAAAAGADPVAFRRRLLAGDKRGLAVLNSVATRSGWATPAPAGRARGVAFWKSFDTYVAEVAEVSGSLSTSVRVHRVWAVIDCGKAINPNIVRAQVEGAIVQGMGAALWSEIPFAAGTPTTRNFNRYKLPRMAESPVIDVAVINSGAALSGVGEPGLPPIAPAIANAVTRLTGTRPRSLPMFPGLFGGGDD